MPVLLRFVLPVIRCCFHQIDVRILYSTQTRKKLNFYYYLTVMDAFMTSVTGYRKDYNVTAIIDGNSATCEQVTTPESNEAFQFKYELPNVRSQLTVKVTLYGGDCLDFPATMAYTDGANSAMLPYHNNPSFCSRVIGKCEFECDCSATLCRVLNIAILSSPDHVRTLCEVIII